MARKFQIWAILLMVCAMGFTVAAQSTSQGASSPKTVTGVVLSAEDGEPIIGAHICAKGTKNGTASDFDGKFRERIFVLKAQKTALPLILMASSALALPMALFSLCHTLDLSHKKLLPTANNQ